MFIQVRCTFSLLRSSSAWSSYSSTYGISTTQPAARVTRAMLPAHGSALALLAADVGLFPKASSCGVSVAQIRKRFVH